MRAGANQALSYKPVGEISPPRPEPLPALVRLIPMTVVDLTQLCEQYLEKQLLGDRRAALGLINAAMAAGVAAGDLRANVVQVAQMEIGKLWQQGKINIAQEHVATTISQLALAHLFQNAQFRARLNRKVLVACVPGEHHEFPARLLADTLDIAGYDVRFLGADVPLDSLIESVEMEKPDVLALSVTMLFHVPSLTATVRSVRAKSRHPVRIAIGGGVFNSAPQLAADIGADIVAPNAEAFVAQLSTHLGAPA